MGKMEAYELLLTKGYDVHGILRRHSVAENQDVRISKLNVKTYYGDLNDEVSLFKILKKVNLMRFIILQP